jgi:ABC-type uncharacterized transport system ATPase subunit
LGTLPEVFAEGSGCPELSGKHTCLLVLQPAAVWKSALLNSFTNSLLDAREANNAILLVSADLDELFLLMTHFGDL